MTAPCLVCTLLPLLQSAADGRVPREHAPHAVVLAALTPLLEGGGRKLASGATEKAMVGPESRKVARRAFTTWVKVGDSTTALLMLPIYSKFMHHEWMRDVNA